MLIWRCKIFYPFSEKMLNENAIKTKKFGVLVDGNIPSVLLSIDLNFPAPKAPRNYFCPFFEGAALFRLISILAIDIFFKNGLQ